MNRSLINLLFLACIASLPFAPIAAAETNACPRFEIAVADEKGERIVTDEDGSAVHVERPSLLTTADFTGANVTVTEGQVVLNINLTHKAGGRIQAFSHDHVGVRLAFILDDRALKVARILDPIRNDGILMGPFPRAQADMLAASINNSRCTAP
jgi:preprotein translocase subunit SecD